jgi:hypothetical protein
VPSWVRDTRDAAKVAELGPFRVLRLMPTECSVEIFGADPKHFAYWWKWSDGLITTVNIKSDLEITAMSAMSTWADEYQWDYVTAIEATRETSFASSRISIICIARLRISGLLIEDQDGDSGYFHVVSGRSHPDRRFVDIPYNEFFEIVEKETRTWKSEYIAEHGQKAYDMEFGNIKK